MPTGKARAAEAKALAAPVFAATVGAAALVAQQVIGKATRDALFLSHFSPAKLPLAVGAGAVVSVVVVFAMTRLIQRMGPGRAVPLALAIHAGAILLEWAAALRFEGSIAPVVYVHTAAVGSTFVSAFWSVVSEGFDPHTAKQVVGRIGAGATLGGVFGGAVAWGASKLTSVPMMLLVMAALSFVCAWGVRSFVQTTPPPAPTPAVAPTSSRFATLRETPYLGMLALVVLVGALLQTLLDYSVSVQATAVYGSGPRLLSFFAIFQTAIGVLSFLLQLSANRMALERFGLGGTMALLPAGVGMLGAVALGAPSLVTMALQRACDGVLRASLFRSAYEVSFTPVPQALKRPTKTLIDVTFDRVGMLAGSALTLGLIAVFEAGATRAVTVATLAACAVLLLVIRRVHRGYVTTLADQLRSGRLELDSAGIVDATTRLTLSRTMEGLDRRTLLAQIDAHRAAQGMPTAPTTEPLPEYPDLEATETDDRVRVLAELRGRDPRAVRRALDYETERLAPLAPSILELLASDALAPHAARALRPMVPKITGAILDVVVDDTRKPTARRRAARLLSTLTSQRAADGLLLGADTESLEVRYACGRVLVGMRERNPALRFDESVVRALALRELAREKEARHDPRGLEHAFDLLSLTFAREPMQLAYGALAASDPFLRGVALEYLDAVLPEPLRTAIAAHLEDAAPPSVGATTAPLASLLQSRDAILLHVDELRRLREKADEPEVP